MNIPIPDFFASWQFWVVAAACAVICEVVKQIPHVQGWMVNVLNLVLGVLLYGIVAGFGGTNIIIGLMASSFATMAYELLTNIVHNVVPKTGAPTSSSKDLQLGGPEE